MNSRPPPPRTKLYRETIVDAAIARVERDGLDQLSARKLARDLSCEAMSLYHHVGNMEALKDAMVDRLLGSIAPADRPDPMQSMSEEAEAYLALAERCPQSFLLIATRRWRGERAAAVAARAVARFRAMGLNERQALANARALGAYINGAGLALAAWARDPEGGAEAIKVASDLRSGLNALLKSLAADPVENR